MSEQSQDAAAPSTEKKPRERQYAKQERGVRRPLQGKVVSTKMQKTIVVQVERLFKHAKYGKYIRKHSKVYAHDEKGEAKDGDTVQVIECRPMSRLKRYRLESVLKRAGS
jgi:small subunit ribosomal protein S17